MQLRLTGSARLGKVGEWVLQTSVVTVQSNLTLSHSPGLLPSAVTGLRLKYSRPFGRMERNLEQSVSKPPAAAHNVVTKTTCFVVTDN